MRAKRDLSRRLFFRASQSFYDSLCNYAVEHETNLAASIIKLCREGMRREAGRGQPLQVEEKGR